MKVLPINNTTPQPSFNAKFPKSDVKHIMAEIQYGDPDIVPQLYTLFEFIKSLPGNIAKIIPSKTVPFYQIKVDGESLTNGREYITAFQALYDAAVIHKNSALKTSPVKRMTYDEFMNSFYKNADKTKKDIENMFD